MAGLSSTPNDERGRKSSNNNNNNNNAHTHIQFSYSVVWCCRAASILPVHWKLLFSTPFSEGWFPLPNSFAIIPWPVDVRSRGLKLKKKTHTHTVIQNLLISLHVWCSNPFRLVFFLLIFIFICVFLPLLQFSFSPSLSLSFSLSNNLTFLHGCSSKQFSHFTGAFVHKMAQRCVCVCVADQAPPWRAALRRADAPKTSVIKIYT